MEGEAVLRTAEPLVASLESSSDGTSAHDEALMQILSLAVAFTHSAPTMDPGKVHNSADEQAAEIVALVALDECQLQLLKSPTTVKGLVQALRSCIQSDLGPDVLARLCGALARLIRTNPSTRSTVCEGGGIEQARTALQLWPAHEEVQVESSRLLFALAFGRADDPAATEVLLPATGTVEEDDTILALAASFKRQQLQSSCMPSAEATEPHAEGDHALVQEEDDPMFESHPMTGKWVWGLPFPALDHSVRQPSAVACVFEGPGCLKAPCTREMPGCTHVVLCAPCEMGLISLADQLPGESDSRALSQAWCPMCSLKERRFEIITGDQISDHMLNLGAGALAGSFIGVDISACEIDAMCSSADG